ncbi:nucleophosmin 1b isoform X1 [Nerophis ophidion]|uniref:nucleophosmin 1b isoform X1 n=1 Tax=Nerophis ophidion TaxID=159077 RepID=UPI002AE086B0|nr:nucleophosmin 1b isoform X1 [Nerophis ophidion]
MEGDISDSNRPQMFLFGCTLRGDKREYKVEVDEDETEQQLSLKAACLGAEAEDKFHMVEVEALTYDGKSSKVPLVVLKPSVLPSMTLGGFEITPPVTLRLLSGSGPVHISGQHFVSVKDSDDEEEEHNTSPVKRPAGLMAGKKLPLKKLKMDDEEDDDDDDDEDEEDDDSDESEVAPQKSAKKGPTTAKKEQMKQNGPAAKAQMKHLLTRSPQPSLPGHTFSLLLSLPAFDVCCSFHMPRGARKRAWTSVFPGLSAGDRSLGGRVRSAASAALLAALCLGLMSLEKRSR